MSSSTVLQRLREQLKSGGWFFVAGLVAGVLNYLFQIVASRELSAAHFADLNGWFANLSIFFFLGGILQYGALFFPMSGGRLKLTLLLVNLAWILYAWVWFTQDQSLGFARAIVILLSSAAYGWVMGQVQIRLAFTLLAFVNVAQAMIKIGLVLVPGFEENRLEAYALGYFITCLPTQLIVTFYLFRAQPAERSEHVGGWRSWIAPTVLSTAVAIMPQYDLVLMSHTQSDVSFQSFSRASLFYKGVYFVFFIVAQWLLPQQIRGKAEIRGIGFAVAIAVLLSSLLTVTAPWVGTWVLHWDVSPDSMLILGSCLHMSLLTLTFLGIQQACADGRIVAAVVAIGLMLVKGGLQFALALDAKTYLFAACILQIPIAFYLVGGRKSAWPFGRQDYSNENRA